MVGSARELLETAGGPDLPLLGGAVKRLGYEGLARADQTLAIRKPPRNGPNRPRPLPGAAAVIPRDASARTARRGSCGGRAGR